MTKRVFSIEPLKKKTLVEKLNFYREDQKLSIETLWKEGRIIVVIDESEDEVVPDWESLDFFSFNSFEHYLDYTWDGQYTEFDGKNVEEVEIAKIEKVFWDDGVGYLEEYGWIEDDPEVFIDGAIVVEEITGSETAKWFIHG